MQSSRHRLRTSLCAAILPLAFTLTTGALPLAAKETRPPASSDTRKPMQRPRLRVGFILARRFTLCAFANFVDVLRLAADEGDRSRPILCEWSVLSGSMDPVVSSCGVSPGSLIDKLN